MANYAIFGEELIDGKTIDQFHKALSADGVVGGALMPDAHYGYTMPIGGVIATDDVVYPSWVGYDQGCGVSCLRIKGICQEQVTFLREEIYSEVKRTVPMGFSHRGLPVKWDKYSQIPKSDSLDDMFSVKRGLHQLGTLGGGNHFMELGFGLYGNVYLIIHSGSRNVGHTTATHYMRMASPTGKASEGNYGFHAQSVEGRDFLMDLNFCLEFALQNRIVMMEAVVKVLDVLFDGVAPVWDELINKTHNHIQKCEETGLLIHRKGATDAGAGVMGVIPGNMRDGSYIVKGKGNPAGWYSASHGCGRSLARKQAKQILHASEEQRTMDRAQVYARPIHECLDEAPGAYKNIFDVMDAQTKLIEIVDRVKPIINWKG